MTITEYVFWACVGVACLGLAEFLWHVFVRKD